MGYELCDKINKILRPIQTDANFTINCGIFVILRNKISDVVYDHTNLLKITEIKMHESLKSICRIINGRINTSNSTETYIANIAANTNNLARRRLTHQVAIGVFGRQTKQ